MPIPADVSTVNIDSDQDDPRLWRADGLDHMEKFNELLSYLRTVAVSPLHYNAVGDGETDDTAAFTALEGEHSGLTIDLLGKTYLVDAVPTGNRYRNGWFRVGRFLRRANHWKIGNRRKAKLTNGSNYQCWPEDTAHSYRDTRFVCFTSGVGHDTEDNRPFMIRSYDDGLTWGALVKNLYPTTSAASNATISADIHEVWISNVGQFVDWDTGNPTSFTSNGGSRTWHLLKYARDVRAGEFIPGAWEVLPHVGTPGYAYTVFQAFVRHGQQFVSIRQRNLNDATLSYKLYSRRLYDYFGLDAPFDLTNGSPTVTVNFPAGVIHGMRNGQRIQIANSGITSGTYGMNITGEYAVSSVLTQSFKITASANANGDYSGVGSVRSGDVTGVRIYVMESDWSEVTYGGDDLGELMMAANPGASAPPAIIISAAPGTGTWDVVFGASGYGQTGLWRISNVISNSPTLTFNTFTYTGGEPCVTTDGSYYYGFLRNNTYGQGPAWFWCPANVDLTPLTEGRLGVEFGVSNPIPIRYDADTGLLFAVTMDRSWTPGGSPNEPHAITKRNNIYVLTAKPSEFRATGSDAWRIEILPDDFVQMAQVGGSVVGSGSGVPSLDISGDLLCIYYASEESRMRGVNTDPDETNGCPNIICLELNKWDFVW